MKSLTAKEEELMTYFWVRGPLFVREILSFYEEPKPHFNTLSTIVRGLEDKGYLGHKAFGKTYQYFPLIKKEEYSKKSLKNVINKYFDNSYLSVVSSLISEEKITIEELQELIRKVTHTH